MDAVAAKLAQQLDRPPAPAELAAALGTTEVAVFELIRAARTVAMLSLDDGTSSPEALLVRDILPCPHTVDPSDAAAEAELIDAVAVRIGVLPEAERRVITMYYREGLLLREIGEVLGVTESRVSQIHSRALARLQDMLRRERDE
jgi:RNA polymerase sigma factor for flagellar operon FliA